MDELENPALPAAGEASPTIPPLNADSIERKQSRDDEPATALPVLPKPARPGVKREGSAQPPQQPPPAIPLAPAEELLTENPDSLTLADLKRLRDGFPPASTPVAREILHDFGKIYNFEYHDAQSFPAELEEWFSYSPVEEQRLRSCQSTFNLRWRNDHKDWLSVDSDTRKAFVQETLESVGTDREQGLQTLVYIALGVWEETAGRQEGCDIEEFFVNSTKAGSKIQDYRGSSLQIQWMLNTVDVLHACDALPVIYKLLQSTIEDSFNDTSAEQFRSDQPAKREDETVELWCCLTLMYIFIEVARTSNRGRELRDEVRKLEPNLLNCFTQIVAKLRWDENAPVPLTKMLLLSWKAILVCLGGLEDIEAIKATLRDKQDDLDDRGQPVITASPLDYHLFRQEISSKYPAYIPPAPLFAFEPENNSILPPLQHRRPSAHHEVAHAGAIVSTDSIMTQPIHIATPAPSPPPSPAAPGKAGKKQNYQTNQMFPFLYPPLESNSNDLGGKGSTELQDTLAGRKWDGLDIPTSILEAAELFSKRMRATRAMKQLWAVRVDFMKYERGWKEFDEEVEADHSTVKQLEAVGRFYHDCLPHLQSVVIVLLKAVLQNVTDLVTRAGGNLQTGFQYDAPNGVKPQENGMAEESAEEIDRLRLQEISGKALSAILLLLLKWFKVSHVLQYEYMTQLLLDSNYVPLVLKLWQTQEIGRACHISLDRPDANFFYFCQAASRQGPPELSATEEEESEDEAAPPPIRLSRDSNEPTQKPVDTMHPPEIDELGYPLTPLPSSPIENYSYRNIFSSINYLRVLQKVTRRKTHRSLLLVSYKSSNHLKKTLRIPVQMLRHYTLKLFKSQVPFCGRKYRQANMKVITAVWLSLKPELRDDYLCGVVGADVDGAVDDALPLEQSLRALTHWWNVRKYPDVMGVDKDGLMQEEVDFFQREIGKIELARSVMLGEEDMAEEPTQEADNWQGPIEGY